MTVNYDMMWDRSCPKLVEALLKRPAIAYHMKAGSVGNSLQHREGGGGPWDASQRRADIAAAMREADARREVVILCAFDAEHPLERSTSFEEEYYLEDGVVLVEVYGLSLERSKTPRKTVTL